MTRRIPRVYGRGMGGVVEYDERWAEWFEQIRAAIPPGLVVEHVGSTAVPGLVAKPIIDVDVVVQTTREVAPAIDALAIAGWRHRGNQGIDGREAFDALRGLPPHHLYLVVDGSLAHRDHVDLRNWLREHPIDAARYGELKLELAPLLDTDRDAYLAGKAALITELLAAARAHPQLANGQAAED